ncbi:hypothetical protein [Kribbella shirazensis]|uniref:Uncharacterized protein n=1 Tax=Kribbella shirazensis TaxID=1105143 RepID=A0A7X5VJL3_9ACTN|nr:hypothetical protein [Kribbella shirazensis]NIK62279.1 hypothetical protein [Kribbella shirazensis]
MRQSVAVGLSALGMVLLTAACGGESGAGPAPVATPTPTPTLAPTRTPATSVPAAATSTPARAPASSVPWVTNGPTSPPAGPPSKVVRVHSRKVVAASAEQRAAADTFLMYTVLRLKAYNQAKVDLAALQKVASGQPVTAVSGQVALLQQRKHHTIGEVWVDIPAIAVTGSTATLRSCLDNTTIDVDRSGKWAEVPTPYLTATATLAKSAGAWRLTKVTFTDARCR